MVGLVVVSHSLPLAEALLALVRQMAGEDVPLALAAGAGPQHELLGTDALAIMAAIEAVYQPAGVVVLMDLGSALLAAEMAVEMLPVERQGRVRLCAAPLVEGAIAAAVQARLGGDLDAVCQEAQRALAPKLAHLGAAPEGETTPVEPPGRQQEEQRVTLRLPNEHGLHARPAARFVQLAAGFAATLAVQNLTRGRGPAPANSLNALATLGAVQGDEILITASGREAKAALQALQRLVDDGFGERAPAAARRAADPVAQPPVPREAMAAIAIAGGVASGPLHFCHAAAPVVVDQASDDPERAWQLLEGAREATRRAVRQQRQVVAASVGEEQAAIFDAHLLILDDPQLAARVRELIFDGRHAAAFAWQTALAETARAYAALDDPYLRQRAADVLDVGTQVLRALLGEQDESLGALPAPAILFTRELTPAQVARLDASLVLGVITLAGSPTSHSAILARSLGLPMVAGVDPGRAGLRPGATVAIDGSAGLLWVDPDEATRNLIAERRRAWRQRQDELLGLSNQPALTRDGHHVEVAANAGRVLDAALAAQRGAEAIGVLRTEFLFLTRASPPAEDEQIAALRQIGAAMGSRPVIVRTLDVGGDKYLPYLALPVEANPFLGRRGLRLSLRELALFRTQLRAILRAAADYDLRLLLPMVSLREELVRAREVLQETHAALVAAGQAHRWPLPLGIMVETPAAALLSAALASQVDFFSVGTNDLVQYTMAAERGNADLAAYADGLQPAILSLTAQVVAAAHAAGKWVGVCGELAGDPLAVPILVGLGVDELSLNPDGIPQIKALLRAIDYGAARELAAQALAAADAPTVRRLAAVYAGSLAG